MRGVVYPPGELGFRSWVVQFCKNFHFEDEDLSSPDCDGSLSEPQPMSDRPMGLGFPHDVEGIDLGVLIFVPGVLR